MSLCSKDVANLCSKSLLGKTSVSWDFLSIFSFFLFFFELKLFHQLATESDFIICFQFNRREPQMYTLFSLYAQDAVRLAEHSSLPGHESVAVHRTDLWCFHFSPPLSDRKPIGLQQQLSSGSHWPQNSTFCLSVGRGQLRRWPIGQSVSRRMWHS